MSPLPLYLQVEEDMRRRIQTGRWPPGQRIPSEQELCSLYGVSRITVRQAIANLASGGLVVREPGRGTFVREPTLTAGMRGLTSFTEEMAQLGLRAGARVLRVGTEPASAELAERLRIDPGNPIVVIRRVRLGNGKPIGIQTSRLIAARFPGLEEADLTDSSLYAFLEEQYGVVPTEAEETFDVVAIDAADARVLGVKPGVCGFRVQRLTFDLTGPFEFVTSIMRGDRYQIRLGLRRTLRREPLT